MATKIRRVLLQWRITKIERSIVGTKTKISQLHLPSEPVNSTPGLIFQRIASAEDQRYLSSNYVAIIFANSRSTFTTKLFMSTSNVRSRWLEWRMKETKRSVKLLMLKTKCDNAPEIHITIGRLSRPIYRAHSYKAINVVEVTISLNLCVKVPMIPSSKIHIFLNCLKASHSFPSTQIFCKNHHHRHPSKTSSIQRHGWSTTTSISGKYT